MINAFKKRVASTTDLKLKHAKLYVLIVILISALLGGIYLHYSWLKYQDTVSADAVLLAQSLETLLKPEDIAVLTGSPQDLDKPEYITLKRSLADLVENTKLIYFAYLFGEKNGNLIFLVDSETPDSPDYSPPGQVYNEATEDTWEPFRSGRTILSAPTTDRWGTWISALVPIKDPVSGKIIAVFGLDYSAKTWNARLQVQMIPDMIIVGLLFLLVIALLRIGLQYYKHIQLSKKLAYDEAIYRSVFNQAPIGIAIVNDKNFVSLSKYGHVSINPMFEKILGRTSHELEDIKWPDITHPDDLRADNEYFTQFHTGKIDGYAMEKRFLKPDGSSVWTYMKIARLHGRPNEESMHLCLLEDISVVKGIEESLIESERSKSVLISNLPGMAYRCNYDRDWTMQFVSAGSVALTGYAPESLINNKDLSFNELIKPEYRELLWNNWVRVLEQKLPFKDEYEIITASGEHKWVLEIGQGIYNAQGEVEALEGIILDISERKEMENELRYHYEHDSATGLYNRGYLDSLLIKDAKERLPEKRAFISINLSTVQSLSMTYGVIYTQELIKKIAGNLERYSSEKCMLFQTYENQFAFYYKGYNDMNELLDFGRKIADVLEDILSAERVGGGIGIIEIDPEEEPDLNKLSKKVLFVTDKAISLGDKEIGICVYDHELKMQIEREENIKQELDDIASKEDDGRLFLQYQPILDLATNQIYAFEALARLKTEKLGRVPPLEFIPVAEKTKLIIPIGWKIIRQAFSFLNKLKDLGYGKINVSINVSAIQLLKRDFVRKLFETIEEMKVTPENIGIEITESIFVYDYDEINRIITELRNCGLNIAIDDFGTGYSSLSRERELNIDCLKIDKYFIDKLLKVHADKAITADIVSMAHKLGHCTIAEGVEYDEQRQYLHNNGCDKIQGYLIGKPMDENAAIEMLKQE